MFTVNGKEENEVFMVLDGAFGDPDNCVLAVAIRHPENVLCPNHMAEFLKENREYLLVLCAEVHRCWLEAQESAPTVH